MPAQAADKGAVGPNAMPMISIDDVTITEGDSGAKNAVFTVSLSEPSAVQVSFLVGTAELSAIGNDDFQHFYSSPRSFAPGETSTTLNLVIFGDAVPETNESFQVLLENVSNATVAKGVGIGTIVNDDGGDAPTLLVGDLWTVEGNAGGKTANFTVQLSQPAATDVSFSIATANGTASSSSDYAALNLSNQIIPAGQLTKTIAVTINGDSSTERDETFTVNLSNVSGATLGRGQAVGTIGNDDGVSAVKISVSDVYYQERNSGPQVGTFYVTLSQPAASTVTFDIKTEDSSATAGSDYVAMALNGQTIAAGQTTRTFNVTVNGDTLQEIDEHFVVTLSNISTNASVQYSDPHGVGVIPNDDISISIGDASIVEGDAGSKYLLFPLTLSGMANGQIQFHFVTCDGTATVAGSDYRAHTADSWSYFTGGTTTMNVSVEILGDYDLEGDETFCVDLTDVSGAAIGDGHAIGTIVNDDVPTPTVSVGDASWPEGDSGIQYPTFPLTLTGVAKTTVYVTYHTESCGGAAQPDINVPYTPGDYTPQVSSNAAVPAGYTSGTISIGVRGDTAFEPDEQFCVKIDGVTGAFLGNATGIGTILNDDAMPAISIIDASVTERSTGIDPQMIFAVALSKPADNPVTFDVVINPGTAVPGVDFVMPTIVGLSIPAGQTYTSFTVTVKGDDVIESDETFTAALVNVVGLPVARAQARGTILNDDNATLSIADATVVEGNEGASTASFVITLSQPMTVPVQFTATTSPITATAGADYVTTSQVSRRIDPGRTQLLFEVPVNGDTLAEPQETFSVVLSAIAFANYGDTQAIGYIQDDDAPALTAIAAIQGSGAVSPLLGQTVAMEGVVTAVTDDGFFLQSQDDHQDGDPATAEGVFVSAATVVAVAERVHVQGRVQEVPVDGKPGAATQTQVSADAVSVIAQGQALPQALALSSGHDALLARNDGSLERFEGMRVAVSPLTVLAPSGGSIDEATGHVRSDGRFYSSVHAAEGRPQSLRILSAGQRGASAVSVDRGDVVSGLVGVLGEGRAAYELLPDPSSALRISSGARPTAVASARPSEAAIGSFNLRRFFNSSRQANEPVLAPGAYATRLAKTANAICAFAGSPAILGLQEIENAQVLGDLAAAVNSRAGNVLFPGACARDPAYRGLRDASRPDSRLGLLVSTAMVRPGVPRVEVHSVVSQAGTETFSLRDGRREPLFESAPLLVQARVNGEVGDVLDLALVVASSSDLNARAQTASHGWAKREDYLRARSEAQSRSLARLVRAQQRAQPRLPLVLLTDLKAPLAGLGLSDLTALSTGPASYSVRRDGQTEAADRVLVSQALAAPAFAPRLEFARINADFGEDNYGDSAVPLRVSDHDPVVLFLQMH